MSRYGFRRTPGLWLVLVVERDGGRVVDWQETANAASAGIVGDNLQHQYHPSSHIIVLKSPEEE